MTVFPTMLNRQSFAKSPAVAARPVAELIRYTTLMDLRAALRTMELLANVTVVLALDERFCGHLESLVARPVQRPAMRLVLAVGSGRLPGLETIGDLSAGGAALGWHEIVLETDAAAATHDALATLRRDERLVVFLPSWHDAETVEREIDAVS